jgi:hypothetical protein
MQRFVYLEDLEKSCKMRILLAREKWTNRVRAVVGDGGYRGLDPSI